MGWAARLLTRLAAMQRAPLPHPHHRHHRSASLSAWRLPLLQLTLVLPLLGEMCAELLTPGLIFLLFPISSISSSWRQRMCGGVGIRDRVRRQGWRREDGGYCQLTSPLQTNNGCRKRAQKADRFIGDGRPKFIYFVKSLLTATPPQQQLDV